MDKDVIIKLNKLNQQFYKIVAQDFSSSRNYYWSGWQKLLPILQSLKSQNKKLNFLDIGCGNGRFVGFLAENLRKDFVYLGLDNSTKLLEIAANNFQKLSTSNILFKKIDLIEVLLKDGKISGSTFDVIVLFGVLHHIPSFTLRQKLIVKLNQLLNSEGVIIVTTWQFLDNPKLKSRLIDPIKINLNKKNLEENDFILDWKRNLQKNSLAVRPLRYCHFSSDQEMKNLLQNLNLKIKIKFKADSKTNQLNQYYILQKAN